MSELNWPHETNQELAKRDQLVRAHQAARALADQLAVALVQRRERRAELRRELDQERAARVCADGMWREREQERDEARARAKDADERLAAVIAECRRVASAWCDIAPGITSDIRRIEAAARGEETP